MRILTSVNVALENLDGDSVKSFLSFFIIKDFFSSKFFEVFGDHVEGEVPSVKFKHKAKNRLM